jgi:ABC-type bacteriocin/lantibiotic exporter with double-glycine peptidase domain
LHNCLEIIGLQVHTLKGIDLQIEPGRCVGLTGPSGSGKSLFLRALADLDPHEGRVRLDGVEAGQMPAHQWRRLVGLLPAESAWWHDSVGPHLGEAPAEWLNALGFDAAVLDWQISRLSSGERQRLALLRLLVLRPKVLLLDEPTANLDHANIERVEALLAEVRRSRPLMVVWVSHDLEQLRRNCDPVYRVDGNRIQPLDSPALTGGGRT